MRAKKWVENFSWIFNDLFSKYGFQDGDAPYADEIHELFSAYLANRGFENNRVSSLHNRRVVEIRVAGRWFGTRRLAWGPPWSLIDREAQQEVPVPPELERSLRAFLAEANGFIKVARAGMSPQKSHPIALGRTFPLDGRPGAVQVNIVAGDGRQWIKVTCAKAFGIASSNWIGRPKRKKRGLKCQAERLLRAAFQNPANGLTPRVIVVFCAAVSREVADALRAMGAEVGGQQPDEMIGEK